MSNNKFDALIKKAQDGGAAITAVAYPCSALALQGAVDAAKENIIKPILVGPKDKIQAAAKELGADISSYEIVDTPDVERVAANKAVELCREGKAETLMKGSLHTDAYMGAVVARETGLRTKSRISHVFAIDCPNFDKLTFVTDAAVNIAPTLEDKFHIVNNSIDFVTALGINMPKVAILAAVENINPKMLTTIEAAALCKMADRGQIKGAILDGPLALDNAVSKEAAEIKGIKSDVAGDPDILLAPNLEAGNMIYKMFVYSANSLAAGLVIGAKVPVILTSRADTAEARKISAVLATLAAQKVRK